MEKYPKTQDPELPEAPLARRIWRRYGVSPGVIPLAAGRRGLGAQPLLADLERRRLRAAADGAGLALPIFVGRPIAGAAAAPPGVAPAPAARSRPRAAAAAGRGRGPATDRSADATHVRRMPDSPSPTASSTPRLSSRSSAPPPTSPALSSPAAPPPPPVADVEMGPAIVHRRAMVQRSSPELRRATPSEPGSSLGVPAAAQAVATGQARVAGERRADAVRRRGGSPPAAQSPAAPALVQALPALPLGEALVRRHLAIPASHLRSAERPALTVAAARFVPIAKPSAADPSGRTAASPEPRQASVARPLAMPLARVAPATAGGSAPRIQASADAGAPASTPAPTVDGSVAGGRQETVSMPPAATSSETPRVDVEELTELVLRRLTRRLAVEGERRGVER